MPHPVFGVIAHVSFYGHSNNKALTFIGMTNILDSLENTRCPYIMSGSSNVDEKEMSSKLSEWRSYARDRVGRNSCVAPELVSND